MLTLGAKWVTQGCPIAPKSAIVRCRKNGSIVFLEQVFDHQKRQRVKIEGRIFPSSRKKRTCGSDFYSKIGFDFYLLYFLLVVVYVVAMGNLSDFMIVFNQFFCDVGEHEIRHVAVVHDDVFDDGG